MSIKIACVQCHKQYSVGEQFVGRAVRCKNCGASFVVRSPAAEPAASDLGIDLNDVLGDASGTPSHAASYGNLAPYHPATRSPRAARSTEGTGSLKRDALLASVATGGIFLLLVFVSVLAVWYIGTHPLPGATREQRAAAMGGGLGTLFSFFFAIPWIVVAIRHGKRRAKQPAKQTSTSTQASQPAGFSGYGNSPARPRSPVSGNRKLWIGLGVGGGVLALLLLGVVFVVSAVKKQVRRAEVRKMMQDPQWRERVLGEKQGWQMYTDSSPVYGFSVELPNPPLKQHQGFAAGGTQWIVMAHRDKETFSVVTVRPAMGIDSGQAEQLRNSANQVVAGMKARVTSQRPVTLGEFAGTEFDYESLAGQKSFSGRIRLFATSNMLFQVGWMASPRAAVTDDVARFLDSFSLPETAELPREPHRMPDSVLERPAYET